MTNNLILFSVAAFALGAILVFVLSKKHFEKKLLLLNDQKVSIEAELSLTAQQLTQERNTITSLEEQGSISSTEINSLEQEIQSLKKQLKHEKELIEMGLNGYNYAKTHFDRTKLAKEYVSKIQNIV